METLTSHLENISNKGYAIIEDFYTPQEVETMISAINEVDKSTPTFRKTRDLFAIRQFLKEVPKIRTSIFNDKLKSFINELFGPQYFSVKSIYFDKPKNSNWFVAWHQDLTISINKKTELVGYGPWTKKLNQFAVQPPLDILQDNFALRIHLDDTNTGNGALKVVPGSHLKNICRPECIDWQIEKSTPCNVKAGGIMIMRPLLLHASSRTTTNKKRRVIHIEFSKADLPPEIQWAEKD